MNFLVLTPDGVGSTYLQRALTVYLNASGAVYYNTHELLNGLMLDHYGNLHKRMKGYSQPLSEICELLEINKAKIILVSRSAETRAMDDLVKAQTTRVYAKKELAPPKKNIFFPEGAPAVPKFPEFPQFSEFT